MRRMLMILPLAAALLTAQAVRSELPQVRAWVEPDSVQLGDLFDFVIEVERDLVQTTDFPTYRFDPDAPKQPGEADVELVEECPVDTLAREGRMLRLRKRYRMQVFDEGRINMGRGAVLFADKNVVDTLYAPDSVWLTVAVFQIDSTSPGLYDIRGQKAMPFKFGEIGGYLTWGLLALLAAGAILFGLQRWLASRGRKLGDLFKPAPPLPPHVAAIQALEALHHKKLWQNGKFKLYYSELTDILRTYIAGRYGIGAMEMTSDEILEAMRSLTEKELPKKAAMDLTTILRDADLVKFAKAEPDAEQNENDYTKAYYFVEETKVQEEVPADREGLDA